MEKIKEELITIYKDMGAKIGLFKKNTYQTVFEEGVQKHQTVISDIIEVCAGKPQEEQDGLIEELADAIPSYAQEQLRKEGRLKKSRQAIDNNMNMAVYVLPILIYTKEDCCMRLADRIAKLWNKKRMTSLKLQVASYDEIAAGFTDSIMGIPIRSTRTRRR